MASRKQPTPSPFSEEPYPSGDNPSWREMLDSATAMVQAVTRCGNQLGGLDHLERIGDALDGYAELSRIRAALEALVLLMATGAAAGGTGMAPNLRDAAVKASNRIASLHP